MFRYIALAWDAAQPAVSEAARSLTRTLLDAHPWQTALRQPGLVALFANARANTDMAYALPGDRGVVLGRLFRRDDDSELPSPVDVLDEQASERIIRTTGRELVQRYWGRYVAILVNPQTRGVSILRDPLGTLPCFHTDFEGVHLYFSCIDDAVCGGVPPFSINWDYIAAQTAQYALECRATALKEVSQVLGGECFDLCNGEILARTLLWNPHEIAASDAIEDRTIAAATLRRIVRLCVRSWASCYARSLIELSGGLDSSIVLSCLPNDSQSPDVVCINYFSPGSDTDERSYARLAAAAAGRELIEHERDPGFQLERILGMALTPKPTFYLESLEYSRLEADIARARGATAILTGTGGDQIFHQSQSVLPAVDYARKYGLRTSLVSVAFDSARLARVTLWTALRVALRDGLLRRSTSRHSDLDNIQTLVDAEIIDRLRHDERFLHPMLKHPSSTPPGKFRQLAAFLFTVEYRDPFGHDDDPDRVNPLLSQPLIELCLRIPTYTLTNGGWDRALARQAFSGDLPAGIARRRSKGSNGDHYEAILLRNLPFVRSMLLDGALMKERLLDSAKLEKVLSDRPTRIASQACELHTYLGMEAWARRWAELHRQDAA